MCILELLKKYSDADHILTRPELEKRLEREYGMTAGRKAIAANIALLVEMGYDISCFQENHKGYYLRDREFDDLELRVLMDSVLTSKYIPESDASRLIEKLADLSTVYFSSRMRHVCAVQKWHHQRNREFFYNLDVISDAIECRRKITFCYNQYGTDGKLHPVRERPYSLTPYSIVCSSSQYYLVGNNEKYENLSHYRIDQMTRLEMTEEKGRPITQLPGCREGIDPGEYARQHLYMYGGKPTRVVLKMAKKCAGEVVDIFGDSATMKSVSDEEMLVTLLAAPEGIRFFVWQFGTNCEVISPKSLRDQIAEDYRQLAARYSRDK